MTESGMRKFGLLTLILSASVVFIGVGAWWKYVLMEKNSPNKITQLEKSESEAAPKYTDPVQAFLESMAPDKILPKVDRDSRNLKQLLKAYETNKDPGLRTILAFKVQHKHLRNTLNAALRRSELSSLSASDQALVKNAESHIMWVTKLFSYYVDQIPSDSLNSLVVDLPVQEGSVAIRDGRIIKNFIKDMFSVSEQLPCGEAEVKNPD